MNIKRLSFWLITVAILPMLAGVSGRHATAFASPTAFEIPIDDLKKVEKKKQRKTEGKRSRKQKKTARKSETEKPAAPATAEAPTPAGKTAAHDVSATIVEPAVPAAAPALPGADTAPPPQTAPAPLPEPQPAPVSAPVAQTESKPAAPSAPTGEQTAAPSIAPAEDDARISHEPYSYVVAGKLTSLMAVVIGKNNVRSMHCRFRATKDGPYAEIAMPLAPGSKFTYRATLPALIPGAAALYYEFVVTGNSGRKTRSPEYSILLSDTGVVPGWQQELGQERIKVLLENPAVPFEGFIGITAETKQK